MIECKDIEKMFHNLTFLEKPYNYNLKINKMFLSFINRYDLLIISRMFKKTEIEEMDKEIIYQLEEIKDGETRD